MPELPEVEHARLCLERWLLGGAVTRAFSRSLLGQRVVAVERRGKWLRLALSGESRVFSHLGMSGRWVKREASAPRQRWERGRIDVEGTGGVTSARYVDPRRFGRLLVSKKDLPEWAGLGPDALVDGLDARTLGRLLGGRSKPVKEVLMDQTVVAGIGNILATEGLWNARIDPRSRTSALSQLEMRAVARGMRAAIARGLTLQGGDDEIHYVKDAGSENPFRIYGRAGEPCPRCKAKLERVVLAGRGTTFCATCQTRRH